MTAKSIKLDGYGTIMINPISIKDKEFETVDPTGATLKRTTVGTRAKTVYVTEDGTEIPNSQVCKKIVVEEEEIIAPKFQLSSEISNENISQIDDNGIIYRALDRKFYNVVTDNEAIKDMVINQNKTLEFPFVAGSGWKIWKGVLTNWNNKLLLVCCRGDIQKELKKYSEETLEIEIGVMPQQKNMKKLVKAMCMID